MRHHRRKAVTIERFAGKAAADNYDADLDAFLGSPIRCTPRSRLPKTASKGIKNIIPRGRLTYNGSEQLPDSNSCTLALMPDPQKCYFLKLVLIPCNSAIPFLPSCFCELPSSSCCVWNDDTARSFAGLFNQKPCKLCKHRLRSTICC